jgi:hypothetical protein
MAWKKISFDQINEYSSIPHSIGSTAKVRKKTAASILQEYEFEKWGQLKALSKGLKLNEHDLLGQQAHKDAGDRLCLLENEIWLASGYDISCEYVSRSVKRLRHIYIENNCNTIVELGAGYGRLLIPLMLSLGVDKINKVHALDYTDAALEILNNVTKESNFDVRLKRIDLSEGPAKQDLPDCDETFRPLVFSSQAIMYVPILQPYFFDLMNNWRAGVFCFIEPSLFNLPSSPLRLLQERYIHVNDYNNNLGDMLAHKLEEGHIKNLKIDSDILSENAFLPLQRFTWNF